MGPSANTGKNVKAPTIITTLTSMMTKSALVLGKVDASVGTLPFAAKAPAMAKCRYYNNKSAN